jgi:hypothetical protein
MVANGPSAERARYEAAIRRGARGGGRSGGPDRMRGNLIAGEARIERTDLMRFKCIFTDSVPQEREREST